MIVRLLATASAASLVAGAAFAGDFAKIDADGSGGLSFEEAAATWPEITADDFAAMDADGSGEVSEEEMAAAAEMKDEATY